MIAMPKHLPAEDPRPVPPTEPDLDECCHSGCVPCIFDLYEEAVERYRIELKAWEERRARIKKGKPRRTKDSL